MRLVKLTLVPAALPAAAVFAPQASAFSEPEQLHSKNGVLVKGKASTTLVRSAGEPSVHDEAVAGQRVFDAGSVEPIAKHAHDHRAHVKPVPIGYGGGGDPTKADPNAWLFCKIE